MNPGARILARYLHSAAEPVRLPVATSGKDWADFVSQHAPRDARRIIASQLSRIAALEAEVAALRRGRR